MGRTALNTMQDTNNQRVIQEKLLEIIDTTPKDTKDFYDTFENGTPKFSPKTMGMLPANPLPKTPVLPYLPPAPPAIPAVSVAKVIEPVTAKVEVKKDLKATMDTHFKELESTIEEKNNAKILSKIVFDALPDLLVEPTNKFISQSEREVFLVSALGVISGMLPNVVGRYDGREVYSNLYVYLIGRYGTGKGTQIFARMIAQVTHKRLREETAVAQSRYKADLLEYEELRKKKLPAEQPIEPKQKNLIIPANISTAGLLQLMGDNDGRGIIIESETDTMTNANNQDFSDSSSIYRCNFHHETLSNYRKTGKEYVEIDKPQLSIILTSTQDQLIKFIPDVRNGLFSRFLFYEMKSSRDFKDVFDERQNDYPEYFKGLGERYERIYSYLIDLEEPIIFDYTPSQKQKLVSEFRLLKNEIGEYVSEDLDGTINRLGLICFRISMIFSTLRAFGNGEVSGKIICEDIDFDNAFRIVRILLKHAIDIYFSMPKPKEFIKEELVVDAEKMKLINQAKSMQKQGVPLRKIALDLLGSDSKKTTISRWLAT